MKQIARQCFTLLSYPQSLKKLQKQQQKEKRKEQRAQRRQLQAGDDDDDEEEVVDPDAYDFKANFVELA